VLAVEQVPIWHLQHATATTAALADVVLLMGFAILIAV
jgi:hypothetical protein